MSVSSKSAGFLIRTSPTRSLGAPTRVGTETTSGPGEATSTWVGFCGCLGPAVGAQPARKAANKKAEKRDIGRGSLVGGVFEHQAFPADSPQVAALLTVRGSMHQGWIGRACRIVLGLALFTTARPAGASERIELVSGATKKHFGLLVAGDAGAVYAMPGGIQVSAAPGTEFKVFSSVQSLQLGPGQRTRGYSVFVRDGRLDVSVAEKQSIPSALMVSAPKKLTSIVVAGKASVFASEARAVVVNREGKSLTQVGAGWVSISAGSQRVRDAKRPTGDTEQTILAPTEIKGKMVRAAFQAEATLGDLGWSRVPGAKAYAVSIVDLSNGKEVLHSRTASTALETPPSVSPGRYEIRVHAIDSEGIDSSLARTRTLHVIGAEVPEGSSFGESDTVYLGARQQLKLSHVSGLKMTYGRADYYVDVPSAVGLYRNQKTSVTFKDAASGDKLVVKLLPRALSAEIALSPRTAVWPRDKITISVKISDPRGSQASASAIPTFKLRLGLKPLKAAWTHTGNVWRTSIEPQGGAGPWVLRVDVSDQQGAPLSRDFVEIASPPPAKSEGGPVARR